jgi:hypothetical protein
MLLRDFFSPEKNQRTSNSWITSTIIMPTIEIQNNMFIPMVAMKMVGRTRTLPPFIVDTLLFESFFG